MCGPYATKWSFAYGIIGLQQGYGVHFNIFDTLPPKLHSNNPSLHYPSSIHIVSQRPSIMVMWIPKWPMGWRHQIHKVAHGKRTKDCKYLDYCHKIANIWTNHMKYGKVCQQNCIIKNPSIMKSPTKLLFIGTIYKIIQKLL